MQISQRVRHAPKTELLAEQLYEVRNSCIGCERCDGVCLALVEVLSLPEAIVPKKAA